jgi:hypothetical protein
MITKNPNSSYKDGLLEILETMRSEKKSFELLLNMSKELKSAEGKAIHKSITKVVSVLTSNIKNLETSYSWLK